jgi:AMMECR1 domain-containing protein
VKRINDGEAIGPWEYKGSLIYLKNKIYLDSDSALIPTIINEYHSSTHEGLHKTLDRIRVVFYWARVKSHIRVFIEGQSNGEGSVMWLEVLEGGRSQ